MTRTPMPSEPKPATDSGPNPDKGVHDSSEHTQFTSPPRRLGTSQDFGDREVSHIPDHGNPKPSSEAKRSSNPD